VLNELRCPETCSGNVDMLWFLVGGDDLELQVPCAPNALWPVVCNPESCLKEHRVIVPQAVEDLGKINIGNEGSHILNTKFCSRSVGESFTSVKQLLMRVSQLLSTTANPLGTGATALTIFPYFMSACTKVSAGSFTKDAMFGDPISLFGPMYIYYRGSVNIGVLDAGNSVHNLIYNYVPGSLSRYWNSISGSTAWSAASVCNNGVFAGYTLTTPPTAYTSGVTPTVYTVGTNLPGGQYMMHVPYQCRFPVSHCLTWDGANSVQFSNPSFPDSALQMFECGSSFATNTYLARSAGDDFHLSFFICAPPVFISYA